MATPEDEQHPEAAALAAELCRLLTTEPYLGRLADALAERLGDWGPGRAELPPPLANPAGPLPIGPYTIPADFEQVTWDGEPPAAPEWRLDPDTRAPSGSRGPQVPRGPLPDPAGDDR